jgi:hypothetical protein
MAVGEGGCEGEMYLVHIHIVQWPQNSAQNYCSVAKPFLRNRAQARAQRNVQHSIHWTEQTAHPSHALRTHHTGLNFPWQYIGRKQKTPSSQQGKYGTGQMGQRPSLSAHGHTLSFEYAFPY